MGKRKNRTLHFQVFAGVMDVIRCGLAVLAIIVLLLMMSSLYTWLVRDINVTFSELRENIGDAILVTTGE